MTLNESERITLSLSLFLRIGNPQRMSNSNESITLSSAFPVLPCWPVPAPKKKQMIQLHFFTN